MADLFKKIKSFEKTPAGKKLTSVLSILFTLGIIAYLTLKLSAIGWKNIWQALPTTPWFYILLVVMFFSLPFFQTIIFSLIWGKKIRFLFPVFLNKRVLDKDILGYSGEMYLYLWARKNIPVPEHETLLVIKDNVIISSVISTFMALIFLVVFFIFGNLSIPEQWLKPGITVIIIVIVCCLVLIPIVYKFRKNIFFLKRKVILKVSILHTTRIIIILTLQVIQWAVVLPDIPLKNWISLLAIQVIITRIPLLPSRGLIFMGAGIEISHFLQISKSLMAGMLLAASILDKMLNLFFFIFIALMKGKSFPHIFSQLKRRKINSLKETKQD